mmetsp:Transcript_4658/g.12714  ORF Transcript_4658/g.12714 Transcript_4658/m.12714 type:complete len:220 (-) Transcript_4658:204-863(-)
MHKHRQNLARRLDLGLRLAPAVVAEGPRRVAQHRQTRRVRDVEHQVLDGPRHLKHHVAEPVAVTCNVAKAPAALLANIRVARPQQADQQGRDAQLHHHVRVLRRCNVGERPSGLELQVRVVQAPKKLCQPRHHTAVQDGHHGRVRLLGQKAPDLLGPLELRHGVLRVGRAHEFAQVLQRHIVGYHGQQRRRVRSSGRAPRSSIAAPAHDAISPAAVVAA